MEPCASAVLFCTFWACCPMGLSWTESSKKPRHMSFLSLVFRIWRIVLGKLGTGVFCKWDVAKVDCICIALLWFYNE